MLKREKGVYILDASGSNYEIGLTHGSALKDVIRARMQVWTEITEGITKTEISNVLKDFFLIGQPFCNVWKAPVPICWMSSGALRMVLKSNFIKSLRISCSTISSFI